MTRLWLAGVVLLSAASALAQDVPVEAEAEVAAEAVDVNVTGRVLDAARFPVAGVTVRFRSVDGVVRNATSRTDGRFALDLTQGTRWTAYAVASDGRYAVDGFELLPGSPWTPRRRPFVLRPGRVLDVRVTRDGDPVPNAVLRVVTGVGERGVIQTTKTDGRGQARIGAVPAERVQLVATAPGHGRALVKVADDADPDAVIELALQPSRPRVIRVVESGSGQPVMGATFDVWDDAGFVRDPFLPRLTIPPTDERGETRLSGEGIDWMLEIRARVDGRPPSGKRRLARGDAVTVIELPPVRTLRWPLDVGEAGIPADGTPLRLLQSDGMHFHWAPSEGVVEDGAVVVHTCNAGFVSPYAVAPDGRIANLVYDLDADGGARTSFRLPRTIVVRLAHADGRPGAGRVVHLSAHGASLGDCRRVTDGEGRVTWTGVHAANATIEVEGCELADVETWRTGADLELTLPPEREYELNLTLDGVPGLPAHYRLEVNGHGVFPEDHAERNAITFRAYVPEPGERLRCRLVAPGRVTAEAWLEPAMASATVDLVRDATLLVRFDLPPGAMPQIHGWLERMDEETGCWVRDSAWGRWNSPEQDAEERFEVAGIEPGVYRLGALPTGKVSLPVRVGPGERRELRLDAVDVRRIRGRVTAPAGYALQSARVLVRDDATGELLDARNDVWNDPGDEIGHSVRPDGTFAFVVPGGATLRLEVRHPLLDPVAPRVIEALHDERDLVVGLVPAPIARIEITPAPLLAQGLWPMMGMRLRLGPTDPSRVLLVARGETSVLEQPLVWSEGSTLRFRVPPGFAGAMWLDLPGLVPHRIDSARFRDGVHDLGKLTLTRGSELRLKPRLAEGVKWTHLQVRVAAREPPYSERFGNSRSADDPIVVHGLGRGEHTVHVFAKFELRAKWETRGYRATFDADGETPVELDVDLR